MNVLDGCDSWRALGEFVGFEVGIAAEPVTTVRAHVLDQRHQRSPLLGERILDPRWNLREGLAPDDALFLERPQAQRQGAGADAVQRALELTETRAAVSQIADHQQGPLAAHDLGGPADWTG